MIIYCTIDLARLVQAVPETRARMHLYSSLAPGLFLGLANAVALPLSTAAAERLSQAEFFANANCTGAARAVTSMGVWGFQDGGCSPLPRDWTIQSVKVTYLARKCASAYNLCRFPADED